MSAKCFETASDFEKSFIDYVSYCQNNSKLPNVAGYTVYANINRDSFYAQKEYYSDTFEKINAMLEDEALNNKFISDTMKIFYMKNKCGYKDRQELDNKVSINNYENLSVEELKKLAGE